MSVWPSVPKRSPPVPLMVRDVPEPIDLVNVFRSPEFVDEIVDECLALGVPRLWLQDGVINERAAQRAAAGGMEVVMDRCIWRDYLGLCA